MPPEPRVFAEEAIAMPDHASFHAYMRWASSRPAPADSPGIILMPVESFLEYFGEPGLRRTFLNLAVYGRPWPHFITAHGQSTQAPAGAV